ncbi:MAG: retroviral-like aspartic protease family protein [Methylomonas sp.]|nr:retroviral-like aspartic protease family protein [Methylomonas sp.]
MGLQDRDYYWEKRKETRKPHFGDSFGSLSNKTADSGYGEPRKPGGLRFLLYPALMMGSLWCAADAFLARGAMPKPTVSVAQEKIYMSAADSSWPSAEAKHSQPRPIPINSSDDSRGVVIKADAKGHFRGMLLINNVPMPFLIDTGATDTVVPAKMAIAAKLPYGRYVQASTAGGKVAVRETLIDSLTMGNAVVHNLNAQMNDHLHEVLIGMSTLRYFKMTQSGDSMILLADPQVSKVRGMPASAFQNETSQPIAPKVTTIKKTVSCDERKVCITKYSDH